MADYRTDDVKRLLRDYFRIEYGARGQRPSESLGTKPAPADEGPGLGLIRQRADLDRALSRLPFRMAYILFEVEAVGATSRAHSCNQLEWRRRVGDLWGCSPGEVSAICASSYAMLLHYMNGMDSKEVDVEVR